MEISCVLLNEPFFHLQPLYMFDAMASDASGMFMMTGKSHENHFLITGAP